MGACYTLFRSKRSDITNKEKLQNHIDEEVKEYNISQESNEK